jgi:hypothetical protein
MTADVTPASSLAVLASEWNEKIRAARKAGDVDTILTSAQAAVAALETAIGPRDTPTEDQTAALKTLRKITYNSAADAYPGWELNTPRSPEQLATAETLARKSLSLTEECQEDAEHHGHALWLIAALDLAQGRRAEAADGFRAAAANHTAGNAPLSAALCEGYIGIATGDTAAIDAAINKITGLNEKWSDATKDQLVIARQVFLP